jgi:hypothetical protein
MFQNCQMLQGEVRETVYVKYMIFRKIAQFHLFQQQRFLIPGITSALGAEGIVCLQAADALAMVGVT